MADLAAGGDADFLAGIAAEHRAVLDESDLDAGAGGGDGGAAPGHATAGDDAIELADIRRAGGLVFHGASPGLQGNRVIGRRFVAAGNQGDGIAAAVEAGEILEGEFGGADWRA